MKHLWRLVCLLAYFATNNLVAQTTTPLEPTSTKALLNVHVTDFKEKPQPGERVYFVDSLSHTSYSGLTDKEGKFQILIPKGATYLVKYKNFGDDANYKPLKVPSVKGLMTFDYSIKFELPRTYTLRNVFFDTGKSTLRAVSFKSLNELAEFLKLKKKMVVEIAGYTDNEGSDAANLTLSQHRAETVRNYLIKKGVSPANLKAKGYGETNPIATNDTPEGRQMNRRTEVHILQD